MSKVKEATSVDCPIHEIMYYAERYFSVHRRGQEPGVFTLSVDSADLQIPGRVQARHEVKIAYEVKHAQGQLETISLAWDPKDQIMPKFTGVLHAERSEGAQSTLTLEGQYTPPFGVVGAAFDAVLGQRIASATALSLLRDIKAFIESNYTVARKTILADSPKD
jgi:hypothetical protein